MLAIAPWLETTLTVGAWLFVVFLIIVRRLGTCVGIRLFVDIRERVRQVCDVVDGVFIIDQRAFVLRRRNRPWTPRVVLVRAWVVLWLGITLRPFAGNPGPPPPPPPPTPPRARRRIVAGTLLHIEIEERDLVELGSCGLLFRAASHLFASRFPRLLGSVDRGFRSRVSVARTRRPRAPSPSTPVRRAIATGLSVFFSDSVRSR